MKQKRQAEILSIIAEYEIEISIYSKSTEERSIMTTEIDKA